MRTTAFVIFAPIILAHCAFAQQQSGTPKPTQPETGTVVRAPHSTKADLAVPLCPAKFNDRLETNGIASKGEKAVTPPKMLNFFAFDISDEAYRAEVKKHLGHIEIIVLFVVDAKGIPGDVCIQKSAGYGLDANAAKAVRQYRFEPATKDETPVPFRFSTEITAF